MCGVNQFKEKIDIPPKNTYSLSANGETCEIVLMVLKERNSTTLWAYVIYFQFGTLSRVNKFGEKVSPQRAKSGVLKKLSPFPSMGPVMPRISNGSALHPILQAHQTLMPLSQGLLLGLNEYPWWWVAPGYQCTFTRRISLLVEKKRGQKRKSVYEKKCEDHVWCTIVPLE